MIGSSRVYLGVHYPSDVMAGWTAGFVWVIVSVVALRTIDPTGRWMREHPAPTE